MKHHLCQYVEDSRFRRDGDDWYHSGCCPCRPKLKYDCQEDEMKHWIVHEGDLLFLFLTHRYKDVWLTQHYMPTSLMTL